MEDREGCECCQRFQRIKKYNPYNGPSDYGDNPGRTWNPRCFRISERGGKITEEWLLLDGTFAVLVHHEKDMKMDCQHYRRLKADEKNVKSVDYWYCGFSSDQDKK